eukprot:1976578-Pyramimonas_sp.AAC.1
MRDSELLPAMLDYCQLDVLCLHEFQHMPSEAFEACGWQVRFSTCRRAAMAFRGPWAATISDSRCGERFATIQYAIVVVSSLDLPTVQRGDDRLDEYCDVLAKLCACV